MEQVYKNQISRKSTISLKAKIKNSPVEGKGLFANNDITKGETVLQFGGNYTNKVGADEALKNGKLIMQWDEDLYSYEDRGDDDGYFLNHSCDSNTWMIDAFTLVAKRDIKNGEEITADYVLWESDENYISNWECKCGAQNCRAKITGKDYQKKNVQELYKDHFSPLIQKKIKGLK